MALALEAAAADAGAPSLLAAVDRIAVPQGTWSYADPARLVADRGRASRGPEPISASWGCPSRP